MNRYLVFAGHNYYPDGGWNDYADSFGTEAEATAFAQGQTTGGKEWAHVVDTHKGVPSIIYSTHG